MTTATLLRIKELKEEKIKLEEEKKEIDMIRSELFTRKAGNSKIKKIKMLVEVLYIDGKKAKTSNLEATSTNTGGYIMEDLVSMLISLYSGRSSSIQWRIEGINDEILRLI